jgi:nucleotide-binding universal stress UspA family protein
MAWINRLVVPLDGSPLAEAALPAALEMAQRFGARVMLLHVMERGAPRSVHGQPHLVEESEALDYLKRVADRLEKQGVAVEYHVHPNLEQDVARSISEHTVELGAELVVMSVHGWGGLRDLLIGSIAQQVLRRGTTPVLLARPATDGQEVPFACHRILVPLNGDPSHEVALPAAVEVGRACGSEVHLLVVVPTLQTIRGDQAAAAVLTPRATAAALDLQQEQAASYLCELAARLQSEGVAASATIRRGDPARVVVDVASQLGVDLIVAATHGRGGLEALWAWRVGPQVLAHLKQPILLVRADGSGSGENE